MSASPALALACVAPLTHGARLRMGNTYGRFSEELPTENEAAPMAPSAELFDQPAPPPTEDLGPALDLMPTSQLERVNLSTVPHDKLNPEELKKKAE